MMLTLWSFVLSSIALPLLASPGWGWMGCGLFFLVMACCMYFIAPLRYISVLMLHEEIKRIMYANNPEH